MTAWPSGQFDFRLPLGAYGNSSGWVPARGFTLKRQPDLAPRQFVRLVPAGSSVFLPLTGQRLRSPTTHELHHFPFVAKAPADGRPDGLAGVSSGGGSALFASRDRVYKLKRCGLADVGFIDEPFDTHALFEARGEFFEQTTHNLGGAMSFAVALAECTMAERLHQEGLCDAYRPLGVVAVHDLPDSPFSEHAIAAVIVEVTSDVRIDELVHMAMSPMLAELFASGRLTYEPASGFFGANALPFSGTTRRWRPIEDVIGQLGAAAGGAYRRLHDSGFLRGTGSAWFGNEVVSPDGELSIVDFDGGTDDARSYPADLAERLRSAELSQYCSESYWFLADMRPRTLCVLGAAFITGFHRGYDEGYIRLPPDLVSQVIMEHMKCIPTLEEGFGFSFGSPALCRVGRQEES